jgi:hypothetical protein
MTTTREVSGFTSTFTQFIPFLDVWSPDFWMKQRFFSGEAPWRYQWGLWILRVHPEKPIMESNYQTLRTVVWKTWKIIVKSQGNPGNMWDISPVYSSIGVPMDLQIASHFCF